MGRNPRLEAYLANTIAQRSEGKTLNRVSASPSVVRESQAEVLTASTATSECATWDLDGVDERSHQCFGEGGGFFVRALRGNVRQLRRHALRDGACIGHVDRRARPDRDERTEEEDNLYTLNAMAFSKYTSFESRKLLRPHSRYPHMA